MRIAKQPFVTICLAAAVCAILALSYRTIQPPDRAVFGGVSLKLEYALTDSERERGLGGREHVPLDHGMLFAFPRDDRYGFWMKDMLTPIDIFWLDAQGHVVYIAPDVATTTYPLVFYPTEPARYVLETAAGFARLHTIATGTPLELINFPSVMQ